MPKKTPPHEQLQNRRKWLEALRSGQYRQGKYCLVQCTSDGELVYCCIGVAYKSLDIEPTTTDKGVRFRGETFFANEWLRDKLGLADQNGEFIDSHGGTSMLTELNDIHRLDFHEIADIIESEPEGLFLQD